MDELTVHDYDMVYYFWTERGRIDGWGDWDKLKPLFAEKHPELIKAWDDYKTARKILELVVEHLGDDDG